MTSSMCICFPRSYGRSWRLKLAVSGLAWSPPNTTPGMPAGAGGYALSIAGCIRTTSSLPVTVRPPRRNSSAGVPRIATKIRVVPNGIPVEDFETAQAAELGLTRTTRRDWCLSAALKQQKDHRTILRALQNLSGVRLLLVGDGPLRGELEELARSLGVSSRVSFLGRRTDVANVLKASDIYVHSTNSDGFGIAACEAMAAGLPVIASDVPGLADVVRGAGVLFPVGDHAALAREIQELLASPERRRQMSKASRRRAQCFQH